jgi:hypothetical protein
MRKTEQRMGMREHRMMAEHGNEKRRTEREWREHRMMAEHGNKKRRTWNVNGGRMGMERT